MHVNLGGYHIRDIEFVAAFDIDKNKVGKDLSEAIYTKPNNTYVFQQVQQTGVTVERGMTHDGLGKYLSQIIEKAPGRDGRHRRHPQGARGRRHGLLPAGRQRGGDQVVRRAGARRRRRVRQRDPGVHRPRAVLAAPVRRGRPAGHRRRHQEPGRRDDHPSRPDPPVHGPRRPPRPHLPAELRRQHGLPQHARARAPRVQEDLQDERRHLDARLRARRRRHPRRPQRPRAVAQGPQVVLHPDGGHDLRRRAAQRRAQARGLGQPQQRRRHHRRHPLPEARPRSRPERARSSPRRATS